MSIINRAVGVAGGSVYRCKEVASGKKHEQNRNEGVLIRPKVVIMIRHGQIKTFGHLYYMCYTEIGCLFLFRVQLSDVITNVIIIRYSSLSLVIAFLK